MLEYIDNNPEFILLIGIGVLLIIGLYVKIKGFKAKKDDKFDKLPFVFYMHGKRFTPEEASEYYEIQDIRNIDPYLMIYDTELKEYIFKGQYSYYQKEYVNLKDNLYHE